MSLKIGHQIQVQTQIPPPPSHPSIACCTPPLSSPLPLLLPLIISHTPCPSTCAGDPSTGAHVYGRFHARISGLAAAGLVRGAGPVGIRAPLQIQNRVTGEWGVPAGQPVLLADLQMEASTQPRSPTSAGRVAALTHPYCNLPEPPAVIRLAVRQGLGLSEGAEVALSATVGTVSRSSGAAPVKRGAEGAAVWNEEMEFAVVDPVRERLTVEVTRTGGGKVGTGTLWLGSLPQGTRQDVMLPLIPLGAQQTDSKAVVQLSVMVVLKDAPVGHGPVRACACACAGMCVCWGGGGAGGPDGPAVVDWGSTGGGGGACTWNDLSGR